MSAAPPPTDDDAWQAAEALAQQQLLTSLATGKVKQPNLIAVVAGIATDKLWRRRRWREREARKAAEAEAEQPEQHAELQRIDELVRSLPDERQRYLRDAVSDEIERRAMNRDRGELLEAHRSEAFPAAWPTAQ